MALGQIETNYSFQEDFKTKAEDIDLWNALTKLEKYIDPELENARKIIKNINPEETKETNNITKLNPKLAKMLVSKLQWQEYIELTWLKSLDEATAKELAKFNWRYLVLSWLKRLNVDTAKALANFNWKLVFNLNLLYGDGAIETKELIKERSKTQEILRWKFIDSKVYIQNRIENFITNENQ